jgi:hypothetical protein
MVQKVQVEVINAPSNSEEFVTIPLEEYRALKADSDFLHALYETGVADWVGYYEAGVVDRVGYDDARNIFSEEN